MAESKGAMLLERTLRMERMAAALQTQVQAELSATTAEVARCTAFADTFRNISCDESYSALHVTLGRLGEGLARGAAVRKTTMLKRFPDTISAVLRAYPKEVLGPVRVACADRDAAAEALRRTAAAHDEHASRGQTAKLRAKELELVDARRRAENCDGDFTRTAIMYETQRVTDMQSVLKEYITANMAYHCVMLEELTAAMAQLDDVEPAEAVHEVADALNTAGVGVRR